ncbi:hypothetical protein [Streptomyces phaeochromogenes]|uniref:hypothetical protein n=1 Tax=Streptomyces phaeochromogenes TaxID=1923 RepID=UPI003CCBA887
MHSSYLRFPADVPSGGRLVVLRLRVRRFFCPESSCARRTFAEQMPGLTRRHSRWTERLRATLATVGPARAFASWSPIPRGSRRTGAPRGEGGLSMAERAVRQPRPNQARHGPRAAGSRPQPPFHRASAPDDPPHRQKPRRRCEAGRPLSRPVAAQQDLRPRRVQALPGRTLGRGLYQRLEALGRDRPPWAIAAATAGSAPTCERSPPRHGRSPRNRRHPAW